MLRRLLVFCLLLIAMRLSAQTNVLKVSADTVKITNSVDSGELVIHNHTRNIPGVLFNAGNGATQFVALKFIRVGDSTLLILGTDTTTLLAGGATQPVYQGDPFVCLYAAQTDATHMQLHWWKTDNDFYQNAKIGVIGDSQGAGVFASTYSNSIIGRLQTFVYAATSNDLLTNYCVPGYNSRNLAPTGSNPYVDNQHNITKALADGNKIILLCNTSNDFYSSASGGVTSLAEDVANTMLISDACRQAGATLFAISTFPRTSLDSLERDTLGIMANYLNQKFGPKCSYVYHLVEDSAHPNQLNPSLQIGDNIHLNDAGCAIVYNAVRDMFTSYYTSNTTVASYELQRANHFNSSFSDYQSIKQPNSPNVILPADSGFYRVRVVYSNGYLSNWSNIIQGTTAHQDSVYNQPPLVTAGPLQTLFVPTSTTTVQVTASDANTNGSISSYHWFVSQGNAATIASPSSATTTVSGLGEGTYIFRCAVTDNLGLVAYADQEVIVEVPDSNNTAAKFNFNASAQTIPGWVDVSGGPLATASNGMTWTNNTFNIGVTELSNSTTVWGANFNNNAGNASGSSTPDAGGYVIPSTVISSAWYTNNISYSGPTSDQLKVTGLSPAKKYKLKFYSSLSSTYNLTANPTIFTVNDNTIDQKQVNAVGNTSTVVIFRGITPNTNGEIPIAISSEPGISQFGMLNGLTVQPDSLSGTAVLPTVTAAANDTIQLPVTSAKLSATASDIDAPLMSVTWSEISGPSSALIGNANVLSTTASNLVAGTYVFSCAVTDGYGATGTANVTVVVLPASNDPLAYVAMSQWSFTSPGWGVLAGFPGTNVVTLTTTLGSTPINVSTISTANWSPFLGSATSDSTGESTDDGGGFLEPLRVQEGCFFNTNVYNASTPQLQITGLPAGAYKVTMFGSLKASVTNYLGVSASTDFRVNGGSPVTINTSGNTSHAAVFPGITVGSDGTMNLFFNPTLTSSSVGMLSYFIIDKTN